MSRIRVSHDADVCRITLARPEKKNALDRDMAAAIHAALGEAENEPALRVVLIDAEGSDFCAGADLAALEAMLEAHAAEHRRDAQALGDVFLRIRAMSKPVVAAVRGRALGGGAGLASACDIVLAAEDATFGYPEVRVGFVPAMVMTMLRRAVSEKTAFDLLATGRVLTAQEAFALGMVSRVIPVASFDREVTAAVRTLTQAPRSALAATKRLLYAIDARDFPSSLAMGVEMNVEARSTQEFREGVRRFLESRRERGK